MILGHPREPWDISTICWYASDKSDKLSVLSCYTQGEIAERENVDQHTVRDILGKMADLPESLKPDKSLAEHATQRAIGKMLGVTPMTVSRDLQPVTNVTREENENQENQEVSEGVVTNVTTPPSAIEQSGGEAET